VVEQYRYLIIDTVVYVREISIPASPSPDPGRIK
jgi:hypothetical protein